MRLSVIMIASGSMHATPAPSYQQTNGILQKEIHIWCEIEVLRGDVIILDRVESKVRLFNVCLLKWCVQGGLSFSHHV